MPSGRPDSSFVAKLPSVQTSVGRMSEIWRKRWGSHDAISPGWGSRLPGGRHLRTFAMKTSSRDSPMPSISEVRSWPAWPTNGMP